MNILCTKVFRAQVHDANKESKGESIYLHENYIAEETLEEARKGVKRRTIPGAVEPLSQYYKFWFRKKKALLLKFPKIYTPLQ